MDITLNQDEIETAVREFIGNQGIDISNKLMEISLTAGRGPNGHSASVTLLPEPEPEIAEDPAPDVKKKAGPKPKATKKKEESVVKDVLEENTEELKEQGDASGFEITDDGPAEPELELTEEEGDEEDDSLFGS